MRRIVSAMLLCGTFTLGSALSGCANRNLSEAQLAYNACTPSYNKTFRSLTGDKAIVSGVKGQTYQCWWRWNARSTSDAIDRAMNDCRGAGYDRCFVYATDAEVYPWARKISDNGGTAVADNANPAPSSPPPAQAGNRNCATTVDRIFGALAGAMPTTNNAAINFESQVMQQDIASRPDCP